MLCHSQTSNIEATGTDGPYQIVFDGHAHQEGSMEMARLFACIDDNNDFLLTETQSVTVFFLHQSFNEAACCRLCAFEWCHRLSTT